MLTSVLHVGLLLFYLFVPCLPWALPALHGTCVLSRTSHVPHNDVSASHGPHIQNIRPHIQKIIMKQKKKKIYHLEIAQPRQC